MTDAHISLFFSIKLPKKHEFVSYKKYFYF